MSDPFIAQIMLFGGNFAPRNWAMCQGQILPISQNPALFSLLGTIYGGDGISTYALPDLRGRTPIGFGTGPGLSNYSLGNRGGSETVTLTANQLPSHIHTATLKAETRPGNSDDPTGMMLARASQTYRAQSPADDVSMDPAAVSVAPSGGNQSHENRAPFIAMNYVIALYGIFPSRN